MQNNLFFSTNTWTQNKTCGRNIFILNNFAIWLQNSPRNQQITFDLLNLLRIKIRLVYFLKGNKLILALGKTY